jgi:hypothetical protein
MKIEIVFFGWMEYIFIINLFENININIIYYKFG